MKAKLRKKPKIYNRPKPQHACILCGHPATVEGLYFPQVASAVNPVCRYYHCDECGKRPDVLEAVERALQRARWEREKMI